MANSIYSDKQLEIMGLWQADQLKRLNLLEGSVRSGKTYISLILWAFWVATSPKYANYIMIAKTLTSLKRNCLDLLQSLVGDNFTYSLSQKEGKLFGRKVYLEGANDARSESKIRGMTLQGAYLDEATLITEDFFTMLLSRLSEPKAKLIATTNPDNPFHWLHRNYIERQEDLDLLVKKFLIDDNIFLDAEYVKQLKAEYTGVFYERFILGRWIAAEGAIYKLFTENKAKYILSDKQTIKNKIEYINIGVDFGGQNSKHAFCASGINDKVNEICVLKAKEYNASGKNPDDLYRMFGDFYKQVEKQWGHINAVYCDSAEQTLINGLKSWYPQLTITNARKHETIDRIRITTSLMSLKRLWLSEDCKDLENAFEQAVYNAKSIKDERLDDGSTPIDILDAFEYSFEQRLTALERGQ